MLIKKAPDIRSSEITPKSVYLRRREFIQASAAALVAAGCGSLADEVVAQGGGLAKLPNVKKSPLSTTEAPSLYDHVTSYNNFYEFETGAGDGPKNNSKNFKPRPWKIADRRAGRQAGQLRHRRVHQAVRARGAHLPHALRRGVVVRDSVGRDSDGRRDQARRADVESGVRRVHHAARRGPLPDAAHRRARVAVHRRSAARRSAAPADAARRRHLRRSAAGAERRADPAGRAVEVRVQGREVARENPVRGQAAAQHLAEDGSGTSTASTPT